MPVDPATRARLAALFLLGLVLFLPPLLGLARQGTVFGIPALFAYVYGAWGGLILALAWVMERASREDDPP